MGGPGEGGGERICFLYQKLFLMFKCVFCIYLQSQLSLTQGDKSIENIITYVLNKGSVPLSIKPFMFSFSSSYPCLLLFTLSVSC
jgi:hypothetical protein